MFKLVILSVVCALVAARPGYLDPHHHAVEYVKVHEPTITKVGAIYHSVPSAVSHQSQTIVHSHGHILTPILAPVYKSYYTPIVKSYHTPIIKAYDFLDYHHPHHHHLH